MRSFKDFHKQFLINISQKEISEIIKNVVNSC